MFCISSKFSKVDKDSLHISTYNLSSFWHGVSDSHYFHIIILMVTQMRKLNKFVSFPAKQREIIKVSGILISISLTDKMLHDL